jgi:hypothetical protein
MTPRTNGIVEQADALYRAAAECCRQHQRYARLVEKGVPTVEQKAALEMAYMNDDMLATAMQGYEDVTAGAPARPNDAWWHRGNMLWHASREYIRRHADCDLLQRAHSKSKGQTKDGLGEMTMEFDLEASALLALKMALDSYRAVRPEAE